MTITSILSLVGTGVAIIVSLVGLYFTFKNAKQKAIRDKKEGLSLDLDNAIDALTLANKSMEQSAALKITLDKACQEYETELSEVKQEMQKMRLEVEEWHAKYDEVKDWAERLVHQIQSYGEEPVPLKPKKRVVVNGK